MSQETTARTVDDPHNFDFFQMLFCPPNFDEYPYGSYKKGPDGEAEAQRDAADYEIKEVSFNHTSL